MIMRRHPAPASLMNPSRIFILRPVATTLFMAAIMLAAGLPIVFCLSLPSGSGLSDDPGPDVSSWRKPGGNDSSVTAPLERQLGQMPGLNQMTSSSSAGASVITLQFSLNLSLDVAEQEVQAAINAANNLLPSGLPTPPVYARSIRPTRRHDAFVTSKTLPLTELADISELRLVQKLSQQPGVGLVTIGGGQRPAVRIKFNPAALAAYGLTSTISVPRSLTPTLICRRGASTAYHNPRQSTPMTKYRAPRLRLDRRRLPQWRSGPPFGRRHRRARR